MKLNTKITIGLMAIVLLLGGYIWFQQSRLKRIKNDRDRIERNFENSNFTIDSLKTKDGEKFYQINQLTVDKDELLATNKDLYNTLNNMKLKIKNLESSTRIEYKYIFQKDTIFMQPENPEDPDNYRYKTIYADDYLDFDATVVFEVPQPYMENVNMELKDTLTTACEFITKQKWFLFIPCGQKVVGTKIHIKSENPYFKLDKVQTYQFDNKKNKKKFK